MSIPVSSEPVAGAAPTDGSLRAATAAPMPAETVLDRLGSTAAGLTEAEARQRLVRSGPNAVRSHGARWGPVLARQLRSPLLILLAVAAVGAYFLGQPTEAVIIMVILLLSVGLGFVNEYRAERAAEALHSRIRHQVTVRRDGMATRRDVVDLVAGDVVDLQMGEIVPADVRLLSVTGLECDESVMTGESLPVAKTAEPTGAGNTRHTDSCAFMGTVVTAGSAQAVVIATGGRAEFGRIALELGTRQAETEFQRGLRQFSKLLLVVAAGLTTIVFVANLVLQRPLLDTLLFSLAIAVGITPQLLPAVVSTSLAAGSRTLARRKVLVKRLVCIEDLGNVQVLMTDKTGTLTEGRITFMRAVGPDGTPAPEAIALGLLCNGAPAADGPQEGYAGGDALDTALWTSPLAGRHRRAGAEQARTAVLPFDHDRRMVSVVLAGANSRQLVSKGAPEAVLQRCVGVPAAATRTLQAELRAGARVIAVGRRDWTDDETLTAAAERDLQLIGFLVFLDQPKASAAPALERLHGLGIEVKVVTGDSPVVAGVVCEQLGLPVAGVLTGDELDGIDDVDLPVAVAGTTVFARMSPQQKARIVRTQRLGGLDVAFLGDGANDAVALHAADIGVSVDSAADVAKDASDIVLLEKDLDVLADGVVEGRRIFSNTMKYVLMGTSSNFGNMFSAATASAVLPFLPMLPSQVLLNNLLYDSSQLTIPTDNVDEAELRRPAHWDVGRIRRFMIGFGPLSSAFDFAIFAIMLLVFHADAAVFHSAWFVESLSTQTLVIFIIRTRRLPLRSHPSVPMIGSVLLVVIIGAVLPYTPLAPALGFVPLAGRVLTMIVILVISYLLLAEAAKRVLMRAPAAPAPPRLPRPHRRVGRRAARFSTSEVIAPSINRNRFQRRRS